MVYWIFIIALIAEILIYIKTDNFECSESLELIILLTCVITIVLTVFILGFNIEAKGKKACLESMYKTLLDYNHVSDSSQNEHYISDVVYWNAYISEGKEMQRDFWIGIFIPNIYDEFECIPLKDI